MPDIWMDVDAALSEVPINLTPLVNSVDFITREEALTFDAGGLDLTWNFVTTAGAFTQTVVTPSSGAGNYDWVAQGNGMYTIEIPSAGGASINNDTEGFGWFTGVASSVLPWRGPIIGFRAAGLNNIAVDSTFSAARGFAGTALPVAAADAAGGLPISDLGGLDLDTQIGTDIDAILADTANMQPKLGTIQNLASGATIGDNLYDTYNSASAAESYALSNSSLLTTINNKVGTPVDLGTGADLSKNLVDIEAETDDIGAAGAGLSAIPWNAAWDAEVESEVDDALGGGTGTALTAIPWNAAWDAEVQSEVEDAWDAQMADSIPADGTIATKEQALYMIVQFLNERVVSDTTVTVRKVDGTTSLYTLTLSSSDSPTSITRAT